MAQSLALYDKNTRFNNKQKIHTEEQWPVITLLHNLMNYPNMKLMNYIKPPLEIKCQPGPSTCYGTHIVYIF